jgi:hypothetical protein
MIGAKNKSKRIHATRGKVIADSQYAPDLVGGPGVSRSEEDKVGDPIQIIKRSLRVSIPCQHLLILPSTVLDSPQRVAISEASNNMAATISSQLHKESP